MAELFLAKDTRQNRLVVLKRILPYLADEAEFVRMFLDEARIAAALHHPNIVELYELGRQEESTFIAMEWVDGVDLRRIIKKEKSRGGFVPVGVAAWIMARLCEGLHHAHLAKDKAGAPLGIIHRDVSPQNVMISFRGDVKLVDFGIAKVTAWVGRSKPGIIKGKFLYLAPEQLMSESLDHRTDLFALGTLLYEVVTGQSPFLRASTEASMKAIRNEAPAPLEKMRKGVPSLLSEIVQKCLMKDRAMRYQTADEVRAALEHFIQTQAPASRDDVARYIATLFGDEDERTSLYIPPNAQSPEGTSPVAGPQKIEKERKPTRPPVPDEFLVDVSDVGSPPKPAQKENTATDGLNDKTVSERPRRVGLLVFTLVFLGAIAGTLFWAWQQLSSTHSSSMRQQKAPSTVNVQIRAIKGTSLSVDGQSLAPDEAIERNPGPLIINYACPTDGAGKVRADISGDAGFVVVEIPCR